MDLSEYRNLYKKKDASPGWDAISSCLEELYPGQKPMHWGTVISHMLGGPDPLDGISAYWCKDISGDHLHFCTYGYTSLYYDEDSVGGDYSQYGFEMTFRLANIQNDTNELVWVCNLLQNIARYVFESNRWFEQYHWIPANGPICSDCDTQIVGLAFLNDTTLRPIDSPHGRVEFIQAFGVTQAELDTFNNTKETVKEVIEYNRKTNPLLVTDLLRK